MAQEELLPIRDIGMLREKAGLENTKFLAIDSEGSGQGLTSIGLALLPFKKALVGLPKVSESFPWPAVDLDDAVAHYNILSWSFRVDGRSRLKGFEPFRYGTVETVLASEVDNRIGMIPAISKDTTEKQDEAELVLVGWNMHDDLKNILHYCPGLLEKAKYFLDLCEPTMALMARPRKSCVSLRDCLLALGLANNEHSVQSLKKQNHDAGMDAVRTAVALMALLECPTNAALSFPRYSLRELNDRFRLTKRPPARRYSCIVVFQPFDDSWMPDEISRASKLCEFVHSRFGHYPKEAAVYCRIKSSRNMMRFKTHGWVYFESVELMEQLAGQLDGCYSPSNRRLSVFLDYLADTESPDDREKDR